MPLRDHPGWTGLREAAGKDGRTGWWMEDHVGEEEERGRVWSDRRRARGRGRDKSRRVGAEKRRLIEQGVSDQTGLG